MKKIATSLIASALVVSFAIPAFAAAPLFSDDFNYPLGSAIVGQGGWIQTGTVATNPLLVNAAGLTYLGYPGAGIGNALGTAATSGQDVNNSYTPITGGAAYAAFLVNVVSAQTTGDYFFHFFDGAISGNVFRARVFVKKDAASANYAYGIQFGSNVNTVYTPFAYAPGTTHLLVVKYTFNPNAVDDVVSLFVDPSPSCVEPTADLSNVDVAQADATSLGAIGVRQGTAANAATFQLDGIRIANNWPDAVCGGSVVPARNSTWGQVKSLYR